MLYYFSIEYRKTANNRNAGGLFRKVQMKKMQILRQSTTLHSSTTYLYHECDRVKRETQRDPILSQVLNIVLQGTSDFPSENEFKPYRNRHNELTVHQNCLLWGNRVVVPTALRRKFCMNFIRVTLEL
jgi:hypothetical protein